MEVKTGSIGCCVIIGRAILACRLRSRGKNSLCFGLDIEVGNLREHVAHLVKLVNAFREGAAGFETGNEAEEGVQIRRLVLLYHMTKDDDETLQALVQHSSPREGFSVRREGRVENGPVDIAQPKLFITVGIKLRASAHVRRKGGAR